MFEASVGKDTITGHWEMMGIYLDKPFITFTETGFPVELIQELEKQTGHEIIGNKAASGTEILKELAPQETMSHSKKMIVYTSAHFLHHKFVAMKKSWDSMNSTAVARLLEN